MTSHPLRVWTPPADVPDPLEALLHRIAGGDEAALHALYGQTARRVLGLATRILRDAFSAEEATADVFAQVWREARDFDPARGSVLTWLLTLTRTRALDRRRSLDRHARRRDALDLAAEMCAQGPDPVASSGQREQAGRVHQALGALPSEQREAIASSFLWGLSHSEAAEALGVPLGTIKTRIRLGIGALRRSLASLERMA
jgi:RNA polymerase sigma-70 factor (ECF subfamily)